MFFSILLIFSFSSPQDCYDSLSDLRSSLRKLAENRVESLRQELHVYGFLEIEPNLTDLAETLQSALENTNLAELWRTGGGLKSEFQLLISDLNSDGIIYDKNIDAIYDRMFLVSSSFCLKNILEERGRLPQLDRVRNFIVKLRNVPRNEVPSVLRSLIPMLSEILDIDAAPNSLKKTVNDCITEMTNEINRIDNAVAQMAISVRTIAREESTMSITTTATSQSGSKNKSRGGQLSRGGTGVKTLGGTRGKTKLLSDENSENYVDSSCIKQWSSKLGVMYFGCEIPENVQLKCIEGFNELKQKKKCNQIIDNIVKIISEKILNRMDLKFKKMIDSIATFLEVQENYFSTCAGNVTEFFLKLSVLVEEHRTLQKSLDERSADDLWDLSENFRLENDDREILFLELCEKLRQCASVDELKNNFDQVLLLLSEIESSYRIYHSNSCFSSDKYPLYLIDEFKRFSLNIGELFSMRPLPSHPLLLAYDDIYDETIRLNSSYFENNPEAGGVIPREKRDSFRPLEITEIPPPPVPILTKKESKEKEKTEKNLPLESPGKSRKNSISVNLNSVLHTEKSEKRLSFSREKTEKKDSKNDKDEVASTENNGSGKDMEIYNSLNLLRSNGTIVSPRNIKKKSLLQNTNINNNNNNNNNNNTEKFENYIENDQKNSYAGQYQIFSPLSELAVKLTLDPSVVVEEEVVLEVEIPIVVVQPTSRPNTGKNKTNLTINLFLFY